MSYRARVAASLAAQRERKAALTELKKRQPYPPKGWIKPAYNSNEYREACFLGWISWEEREQDHIVYQSRRSHSLQSCHRYTMNGRKVRYAEPTTKAYTPEASAVLDEDRNSWAIGCMNGVFRQFTKTKPLLETAGLQS